jgi:K+-transporting ATPase ATPase C chain
MQKLINDIRISAIATLLFAVLLGGAYPLAVWAVGTVVFPHQAEGSLIIGADGRIVGSSLIGQTFTAEKYFHSRPSLAGAGYDATESGGSNFGPTSQKLADEIRQRVANYRAENKLAADAAVPADAVTASASGLDPEISAANARLQAARVAAARGMTVGQVAGLIDANTENRDLGVFGEPGVNVLLLNMELDKLGTSQ